MANSLNTDLLLQSADAVIFTAWRKPCFFESPFFSIDILVDDEWGKWSSRQLQLKIAGKKLTKSNNIYFDVACAEN